MTFSAPLKLMFACFAVAALVATAMSGSESAGLKGSRQLQYVQLQYTPANAVNSIITNSFGIVNTLNPPPVQPLNPAATATNSVLAQAANIFNTLNP
jgi:hypothetical protein